MESGPGYEALRRGRHSLSASRYFLTLTTQARGTGLNSAAIAPVVRDAVGALEADGSWRVHAAVIMSDHIHVLITLGDRLKLGQAVGRFKAKTRRLLAEAGLQWQGNYYERHLRPNDQIEDVLLYIFLNPYRANMLSPGASYEWTWFGVEEQTWFTPSTDDNRPLPEWLR